MYTIYKWSVQTLDSQPSNHQGNPSEVLSCAGIQNLNKLIKSWGEGEMEQLSGLLAVHGWSVPWKGTSWLGGHSPQHPIGLWYPEELLLPLFSHSVVSDSFATPWTIAHQAPLSMGSSRQEYRSGLPFPSPGDLSDPGIELMSPALAGGFSTTEPPGKSYPKALPNPKTIFLCQEHPMLCKTKECCVCVCVCMCVYLCTERWGSLGVLQGKLAQWGKGSESLCKFLSPGPASVSPSPSPGGYNSGRAGKHLATWCGCHWLLGAGLGGVATLWDTYLPGKNVAVSAELKGVSILLFAWVASCKFKIHLLPIQLSFVGQD